MGKRYQNFFGVTFMDHGRIGSSRGITMANAPTAPRKTETLPMVTASTADKPVKQTTRPSKYLSKGKRDEWKSNSQQGRPGKMRNGSYTSGATRIPVYSYS